jgi:hypothetical protein
LDNENSIYLLGSTSGGFDADPGPSTSILQAGIYILKLDSNANLKWTYSAFREVVDKVSKTKGNISNDAITNPKTIINSLVDFFNLFKPAIKDAIINEVDFEGFKLIVAEKNKLPFDSTAPNFDTPQELAQTVVMINNYEATQKIQ